MKEASKFLPKSNQLNVDLKNYAAALESKEKMLEIHIGRKNKRSTVYVVDENKLSEMFNKVMFRVSVREREQSASKTLQQNNGCSGPKTRLQKKVNKKEVGLRALLIQYCAQRISSGDRGTSTELLKKIGEHSSQSRHGAQRLVRCFTNGKEACLDRIGTQMYAALSIKRVSASEHCLMGWFHDDHQFSSSPLNHDGGYYSNPLLNSINQMLMEEEENSSIFHNSLALQAKEKSLYEVICYRYPHVQAELHEILGPPTWLSSSHSEISVNNLVKIEKAGFVEEYELYDIFDRILLYPMGKNEPDESCVDKEARAISELSGEINGGRMTHRRKRRKKKEMVDLKTLLIQCAQSVSSMDSKTASELLKKIREHAFSSGDGSQRLAYYFANGLEARLLGSEARLSNSYSSLACNKKFSAADMLGTYKTCLSSFPFKKISSYYMNKMILKAVENSKTLHIVDFGIRNGFKWPILIQSLSMIAGGPPKLRITGIETTQSSFRLAESMEDTGIRLAKYCNRFNVPFEYTPVSSQNWETINIEDLKICKDEVVVVTWFFRSTNLLDETVEESCPRNAILKLIRKIKPNLFIHSVESGSYNAPFFITRFREALFHFSAVFDMFDACLARDNPHRLLFEKEYYGRMAMNVIACEGLDRLERPETYKQWHARNVRAGFKPMPLDQEVAKMFKGKFMDSYHKDFVVSEDKHWLLQGWKGRFFYASSCWVPV